MLHDESLLLKKESVPASIFLILLFIVGVFSVSALPGFNYSVIALGVLCGVVFIMASLSSGFFVSTEIKYYYLFITWSMIGVVGVKYPEFFYERLRTLIQLAFMVVILSFYAKNTRCVSYLFFGVFLGVCIVSVSAVATGDFQRSEVEGEEARLAGVVLNANAFGMAIIYGMMTLLYYFRRTSSVIIKIGIVTLIILGVRFIIASGSRKAFVVMTVMVFLWYFLVYGKNVIRRPVVTITISIGILLIGLYTAYLMRDSVLLQRIFRTEESLSVGGGGVYARYVMVKEGLMFAISHPLLGIGLNHFPFYSQTELYAHNNYIEVFATTGFPGGIFYMMIYITLILRLFKVGKYNLTMSQRDTVSLFKAYMVVRLLSDLATVSYGSKVDWIMLAIVIGFTNYLYREYQGQQIENLCVGDMENSQQ